MSEDVENNKYVKRVLEINDGQPLTRKNFIFKFIYEPKDNLYRLVVLGKDHVLVLRVSVNQIREVRDRLIDDFKEYNLD